MAAAYFTIEDLRRLLIESAGVEEGVDLDADIADTTFADLGYESIALLETGSAIEREYSVSLDEESLDETSTPRRLVQTVNAQLSAAEAA